MDLATFSKKIYVIRGTKVMFDRDVAQALGVETKHLNDNAKYSPKWELLRRESIEDQYRFQLTEEEKSTINWPENPASSKHSSALPWVYTKLGCAHFGTSLTSEAACLLAIQLSKAFVEKVTTVNQVKESLEKTRLLKTAKQYMQAYMAMGKCLECPYSRVKALVVQRVARELGVDIKELLIENVSDVQDWLVTPTEIGKQFNWTAQEVNRRLALSGYQIKHPCGWVTTDKGKQFCQLLDVGKRNSNGTPVQQMKWYHGKLMSQTDWQKESL